MKTLPLTKGQVALVDDEDFDRVSGFKWTAVNGKNDNTFYAHRHIKIDGKWKHQKMHRLIVGANHSEKVDHIDGNGCNNQKQNLRKCTHQQNMRNMRIHNKNGFKGVTLLPKKPVRPYVAHITLEGKHKHIGYFDTALEAAVAYNQKAVEHYGEFARLNPV